MSYRLLTLKDIAKTLNTSITTVSRALKGHPSISEKMRQRVHELAKELDYQPNPIALNLLKSRSYTIGVIVPEIVHNFYAMVLEGVEDTAVEAGYNVMFCVSKESQKREENVINMLLRSRMDGLLIAPSKETNNDSHLKSIIKKGIPLVFFDRYCEDIAASRVVVDDIRGAYNAVKFLVGTGCRNIAHIAGPKGLSNSFKRLTGYKEALSEAGLKVRDELIVHSDLTKQNIIECVTKLLALKRRPDAIFAYNSYIAFEGMQVVKERGLKIPKDISFIGFANEPIISYTEPQLTTVLQPAYEMGRAATKMLLDQINGEPADFSPETVMFETTLVIRGSSRNG